MDFLGFMTLDVVSLVPFDCMYERTFDHLNVLILESLVPLVLLVLAVAVMSGQKLRHQPGGLSQQQIWGCVTGGRRGLRGGTKGV